MTRVVGSEDARRRPFPSHLFAHLVGISAGAAANSSSSIGEALARITRAAARREPSEVVLLNDDDSDDTGFNHDCTTQPPVVEANMIGSLFF